MKTRDRLLTAILLIGVGVMIGAMIMLFRQQPRGDDLNPVEVTEVRHSDRPLFTDEMLEKIDSRFLFKTVAQKVAPSVVYIETLVPFREGRYREGEGREDLLERFMPRRVRTVGSGVIISGDGYIITNNHVVEEAEPNSIEVVLDDKRSYRGRVVGLDPTTDIAVLKIDARNLPAITLGNSEQVEVGEWVLAFGNPFQLRSTVTAGIVSALSREVNIIQEEMGIQSFIQTDAAINRGNSGGALVNTSGELIGVNTAIASENGSYQGYGFAVPSNLAGKVARDIIQYGEVRRALLGVSIRTVDAGRAGQLGMDTIRGVEIASVTEGGPAQEAGLRAQDVVLSVYGEPVNEVNELQQKIAVLPPGEMVTLRVWRDGREFTREVELDLLENVQPLASDGEEPAPDEEEREREFEFEYFEELGFRVMSYLRPGGESRLIVSRVEEGGEADRRGLRRGYRIVSVEGERVEDLQTMRDLVRRAMRENGSVVLQIETRDGTRGYYELIQP